MKAILVNTCGGPERLELLEVPVPTPGPGQVLVKLEASGVNFIDIYFRTGLYKADPPISLGMEGAGVVEAVGPEVSEVAPGDRVAYTLCRGSYAQYAVVPAWQLLKLPDALEARTAAAALLQGLTAHYLTHSTFPLEAGQTTLVHAAAGGVGLLLVQMAKLRGARVLATVSTEAKAELARQAGADEVILYSRQDFQQEVQRLTGGALLDVVYDSVGAATFHQSLNCLRPRGMLVSYGQSSGAVPPFDPLLLSQKGSLFLTRPTLFHYCASRGDLLARAADLFGWITSGRLQVRIHRAYPLEEAAHAHRDLAARLTAGKLLLIP